MANIKQYLDNILHAVFGRDVRQSIHDGIEAMNNQIENELGGMIQEGNDLINEIEEKKENGDFLMKVEDLTEEHWNKLKTNVTNYYKKYESVYTTLSENETKIPINISEFCDGCILQVFIEGRVLSKEEYKVNGTNSITLVEKLSEVGTKVHFVCFRSVCAKTEDLDKLKGPKGDSGAIVFNNIADMRSNNSLKDGDTCETLGYYSPNDGGNGLYKIVNDETLVEDNGSIIDLDNGNKAVLICKNNTVNAKQFGANTSFDDNSTYLINALKYIENKAITLKIPAGQYKVSQNLGEFNNVVVEGSYNGFYATDTNFNKKSTIIYDNRDQTDEFLISINNRNTSIKNIMFYGKNNINSCLKILGGWKSEYQNLSFLYFRKALDVEGTDIFFNKILVSTCGSLADDNEASYAIYDHGLQNIYTNIHVEHSRLMIRTRSMTTISNSKFEVSTWNAILTNATIKSSAVLNLTNTIFTSNLCIMLSLEYFTANSYQLSNAPVFLGGSNNTITSNSFVTGLGSGGFATTVNTRTAKYILVSNSVISSNNFERFSKETSSIIARDNSVFTNNKLSYIDDNGNIMPEINGTNLLNQYTKFDNNVTTTFPSWQNNNNTIYNYIRNITTTSTTSPATFELPGNGFFIGSARIANASKGFDELIIFTIANANKIHICNILSKSNESKLNNINFNISIDNKTVSFTTSETENYDVMYGYLCINKFW